LSSKRGDVPPQLRAWLPDRALVNPASNDELRSAAIALAFLLGATCFARLERTEHATIQAAVDIAAPSERTLRQASALRDGERVDVNRAEDVELSLLPGIGPSLARAIVTERVRGGFFRDARDLQRVKGIGSKLAKKLINHIRFESKKLENAADSNLKFHRNSPVLVAVEAADAQVGTNGEAAAREKVDPQ